MRWQFWKWIATGLHGRSGLHQLLWNWWLVFHVVVGIAMAAFVEAPLDEAARICLLPLAGIFVGLSFAWAGNAQALLMETEIEQLAEHHPDGIQSYVYTFQLAILTILVTLILWGLAGLGTFRSELLCSKWAVLSVEAVLYFFASLTVRECWHVVMGSQLLLLVRLEVRKRDVSRRRQSSEKQDKEE